MATSDRRAEVPEDVVRVYVVFEHAQLGEHRLLCGDSASLEDVQRLCGGEVIHLLNTDPPYNVKVEPRTNNAIAAGLSTWKPEKGAHRGVSRAISSADGKGMHHQGFDLARICGNVHG